MFVRIKNGQATGKTSVRLPSSKVKAAIARLLKEEGYVADVIEREIGPGKKELEIALKYYLGKPVIDRLERVSRPGLRKYCGKGDLPKVLGGLGISVISTSAGIMTDAQARARGLGGEVICVVA
jgi:small subunit ribosomal protein S8